MGYHNVIQTPARNASTRLGYQIIVRRPIMILGSIIDETYACYSSVAVSSSLSGILPVPAAKLPGVSGVPAWKSSRSNPASSIPCRLPRLFLTERDASGPASSISDTAKPMEVCRRFGDICRSADRLIGDNFLDTERGASIGFCAYGVCIVGTLKDGRGLARLGVDPFCDECESDDAKDAFAICSIAVLVMPWVLLGSAVASFKVCTADFRRRCSRGSRGVCGSMISFCVRDDDRIARGFCDA
jgi:hypothetical protein